MRFRFTVLIGSEHALEAVISFAVQSIKSVFHALLNDKAFADSTASQLCQQITVMEFVGEVAVVPDKDPCRPVAISQ